MTIKPIQRFSSRDADLIPKAFYNLKADLPSPAKPPLHPGTKEPLNPKDLEPVFPKGFIAQEIASDRYVPIPEPVLEKFVIYRPTPLVYASGLRQALDTPAHIFYKYEGAGPAGSHKSNTALMQAYLAAREGVGTLVTETGAGQWGSALAQAGQAFGVAVRVFMVRVSYRQKPGRRILMEMFGAKVEESPSPSTIFGRKFYEADPDHPGSLGIAISEALEVAVGGTNSRYSLGSVLDAVLMHQTVIGLEAGRQLAAAGAEPDVVIGCVGGGSNFGGLAFPFVGRNLREGTKARFVAAEPEACPSLTKGDLRYDHGDTAGMTPLLHMHTLGMDFVPEPIHAGGLRYHGMAPLVSHLVDLGIVEPRAYAQERAFEAGELFYRTEGVLPAPESSHAVAAAVDEALEAKRQGLEKVILFNLSGHGFLDINAYAQNGRGRTNGLCSSAR
ncbi:MAG: TrpB-like pyridoxal phosphate-dependent enzyme, partial [Candidatus Aminicenantes bacterium]|nr:TrpB-like pyridoxal phosphate-dependent enzyme [Candidatus Aminicenantes bacterium]